MLITITEAAKIAGYKSRGMFRQMIKKLLANDSENLQKIGNYYFVKKEFVENLAKNRGAGRR